MRRLAVAASLGILSARNVLLIYVCVSGGAEARQLRLCEAEVGWKGVSKSRISRGAPPMTPRRTDTQGGRGRAASAAAEALAAPAEVPPPLPPAAAAIDVESGLPSPTLIPAIKAAGGSLQLQAWPAHLELHAEPAFDEGSCSLGERQSAAEGRWDRWVGVRKLAHAVLHLSTRLGF